MIDFKSGDENLSYPLCGLSSEYSADDLQDDAENIGYEIFGSWNDVNGTHPWFARIEIYKTDPSSDPEVCGGTLIRDNVVVTGELYKKCSSIHDKIIVTISLNSCSLRIA